MTKKEILALEYEEFSKLVSNLTWEEVMKLSEIVGYPVFTRKCMGDLMHKFVLLQDGAAAAIVNDKGELLLQSSFDLSVSPVSEMIALFDNISVLNDCNGSTSP